MHAIYHQDSFAKSQEPQGKSETLCLLLAVSSIFRNQPIGKSVLFLLVIFFVCNRQSTQSGSGHLDHFIYGSNLCCIGSPPPERLPLLQLIWRNSLTFLTAIVAFLYGR